MTKKDKHKETNETTEVKPDGMSENQNNIANGQPQPEPTDHLAGQVTNHEEQSASPEKNSADSKNAQIRELEEKYKELNDKYLRLFSEFDNFRKRSIKERMELTKTASAEMTEAVLPILDDLERANKSFNENPDIDVLGEGITLIYTKLKTILKHKGLEEIETLGKDFNTDFHEAITHIAAPSPEEKGKVIDEVQKGYLLNGKIIRFAKVVVGN